MSGRRGPRRRAAMVGAPAAALAAACGCAAPPEPSPTGGVSLELHVRGADNLEALYRVGADGTLGFGGGVDARHDRVTWEGRLTAEEIARLRELLRGHGWFDGAPESSGEPAERVTRVLLRWPEGRRRWKVVGRSPDVAPVVELLDSAARRRLQGFLDRLPGPAPPEAPPQD